MDIRPAELDELLCFDLYVASRAVTATYRPILGPLGLTYPQYLVLTLLWARDGRTIGEIAETLRLDHATLTPLLRRMEAGALLTRARSADDERRVLVRLAPAGDALRVEADGVQCRIADALGLTSDQAATLRDLLRTVTHHLVA